MFNAQVLRGLEVRDEVRPGVVRRHEVGAFRYRGAPAADCAHMVARLCEWLAEDGFRPRPEVGIVAAILAAILAHLYLAWIHPFGDGNGRTARLVEFAILVSPGVPMPAAHLLSSHYKQTRAEYYRRSCPHAVRRPIDPPRPHPRRSTWRRVGPQLPQVETGSGRPPMERRTRSSPRFAGAGREPRASFGRTGARPCWVGFAEFGPCCRVGTQLAHKLGHCGLTIPLTSKAIDG